MNNQLKGWVAFYPTLVRKFINYNRRPVAGFLDLLANESVFARVVVVREGNRMHKYKKITRSVSWNLFSPWLRLAHPKFIYKKIITECKIFSLDTLIVDQAGMKVKILFKKNCLSYSCEHPGLESIAVRKI